MTPHILALCLAQVLMLAVGFGLLPLLRLASTWRELLLRLPLAYAIGLTATGVIATNLALIGISVGRVGLPLLAAATLALGTRRIERRGTPWPPVRSLLGLAPPSLRCSPSAHTSRMRPACRP